MEAAASRDRVPSALTYMPQLDGLRAIAVSAVLAQHYGIWIGGAGYGVHLFFVLSGFLITGILLVERNNVAEFGITRLRAFRQFYVRRALRILPLYYFFVLAGIALNVQDARHYAPWLLTYTINLKMASDGLYIHNFSHFWSLAIEEQYYLFWPWLILLLPRRWLVPAAVITVATGPLFRFFVWLTPVFQNNAWIATYIATPTAMDSLGMGSLLAILIASEPTARTLERWMKLKVPIAGVALLLIFQFGPHGLAHRVLLDTSAAIFFAWLIYRASFGFSGITRRILSLAPVIYLGRISYGVYVYHPRIPTLVSRTAAYLGMRLPAEQWARTLIAVAVTIVIASLSWYSFERPINRLKQRFPYIGRTSGSP
jgi:peptidoglycan/LPS O-acetylase OafA/YrhL